MKKDAIQTRNRKMSTRSKKGRKFSRETDYGKAACMMTMDMKYGNFSTQHMGQVNQLMTSNQHFPNYSPYANASFPPNFSQTHTMPSYPSWSSAAQTGFGLSSSMVGAIA